MARGLIVLPLLIAVTAAAYIESVAANVDAKSAPRKHEKFVPLVAFQCGYRNKYLAEEGSWVTDGNRYATCQSGKLDILKYCKRAYPTLNVTNIVEYSHEVSIEQWCREEGTPCKWTHTVRPYQCIVGEFHSEALQVPHDCRFSHVNSRESCNDYNHWKDEATKQCLTKTSNSGTKMRVRSFSVLEPCGLDLFTGVEFVCCPTDDENVIELAKHKAETKVAAKVEEYDEDYEDEEDDSDSDEETDNTKEQDPYFKTNEPQNEHQNFKDAEGRLDKKHRDRINKVMKEWGELEARYKKMAGKDSRGAEAFKTEMTNRFQKTVAALEEENKAQKHELETVHEERVQAALNEKKRQATHDYRQALALHVGSANKHNVLRTLKTYIRAEEKDRIHILNRYRHLLRTDHAEAAQYKPILLHRLRYIDLRINGTLAMLRDFPDLETQVRPIAMAFWADFRKENTPEVSDQEISNLSTLASDEAKNKRLVDIYKETYDKLHPSVKLDVRAPPSTTAAPTTTTQAAPEKTKVLSDDSKDSEEDEDEYYEDEDDEEVKKSDKKEEKKVESKSVSVEVDQSKSVEVDKIVKKPAVVKVDKAVQTDDDDEDESDSDEDSDEDDIKELRVDIEPIIEDKPYRDVHAAPAYYRHEKLVQQKNTAEVSVLSGLGGTQMLVLMGAVVLVSMVLVAVINNKRRRAHAGFIEVDVCTPEERHVSGMQVNGYENPTYSFFDSKA